jgi:hypothetical protein
MDRSPAACFRSGVSEVSWAEKLAKLREGMTPFEVTVTRTYLFIAKDAEHARRTVEMSDERTLGGLLKSESIVVMTPPDGGRE